MRRRLSNRCLSLVFASIVVVTGCGGGGGGDLSERDFLNEFYEHGLCTDLVECEIKAGLAVLLQGLCHPDARRDVIDDALSNTDGSRYEYDARQAERCLEEFESAPVCEGAVRRGRRTGESFLFGIGGACENVYQGLQAEGDPCSTVLECRDGLTCVLDETCPGTCRPLGGEGDSCSSDADCENDLDCASDDTCRQPNAEGESCADASCRAELYCNSETDTCESFPEAEGDSCELGSGAVDPCPGQLLCIDGICRQGADAGEACGDEVTKCRPGTRCIEDDETCIETAGPGESCDHPKACPAGYYCDDGVCTPQPSEGGDCSDTPEVFEESDTTFCFRSTCESGTCTVASKAIGDSCDNDRECDQGYCDRSGVCAEPKSEYESCSGDDECGDGLECREDASDERTCLEDCPTG